MLAGMKHLNRLEQVLAQREWNDPQIEEGPMLDSEGELFARDGVEYIHRARY
jgi:4-amino-4-deoxychorismate lyase